MVDGALCPRGSQVPSSPLEFPCMNGRHVKVKLGTYEGHEWDDLVFWCQTYHMIVSQN
jgi:hypothetical protein